jgi:hypothetical protein
MAVSALCSLFASNDKFLQYNTCVAFASDMTKSYRFLFAEAQGDDYTVSLFLSLLVVLMFSSCGQACGVALSLYQFSHHISS